MGWKPFVTENMVETPESLGVGDYASEGAMGLEVVPELHRRPLLGAWQTPSPWKRC